MKKLADNAAAAGDKIDKQSQALGMSRKAYQEWDYILSQNGSTIDNLGVSMKTLSSAIVDGSKTGIAAFDKLGLSIDDLRTQDMQTQFENVVKAFQKMPEGAEKAALAVDLFGRNGMELLPLLNNTSASIDELRKKAEELGIVMDDDAVNAAVNYTDAMDTLNRTFEAAKNAIGAELLPTLTDLATYGAETIGRLTTAFKSEGLSGAIEEAGKIIGELGEKIKTAFDEIDWVQIGTDIVTFIQSAFVGIAGWFGEKFTAAKDAIGQINWLSVGSQAWAAIVEGIGNIRDWFTTAFNDASDAIKGIDWSSVGSSIWDFISAPFLAIADWFTNTFSTAASAAENNVPWQALGESIRGFIENGISAISETISGFFESAKTTIENINWEGVGTAIKNYVTAGISSIVTDLTNLYNDAADAIKAIDWVQVGTTIRETIEGAIEAISGWFGELFSGIISDTEGLDWNGLGTAIVGYLEAGLSAIDGLLTGLFGDEWTQIKTDAQESWSAIQSAVETAFSGIEAAWNGIVSFFTTTIPEVWNNLKTTAQEIWDGIQSNITTAIDTAKTTLEATWGTIQSKAEEIWGALKTAAETAWQAIQGFIEDPIGTAQSTLETAWADIQTAAGTAWSAIQTAAETAWNAIQSFIEDPISAAQETLGSIWTSIQSAVTEAWAAIENTITEVINAITTPINDFIGTVGSAVDGVLKFLGLKPSETPDWKSDVDNKITTPMSGASSAIQELLGEMASLEAKDGHNLASTTSHHTNYEHTIYTFEGSSGQEHTGTEGKFAKAMFGGKILRGATVFGMNDNGPMIGGEAGPEAIVGVNSLDQMIQKSVSNAVSGILAKMDSLISGQGTGNIEIVLDTGELVGAIGGKMDAELGKIGAWKSGGAA